VGIKYIFIAQTVEHAGSFHFDRLNFPHLLPHQLTPTHTNSHQSTPSHTISHHWICPIRSSHTSSHHSHHGNQLHFHCSHRRARRLVSFRSLACFRYSLSIPEAYPSIHTDSHHPTPPHTTGFGHLTPFLRISHTPRSGRLTLKNILPRLSACHPTSRSIANLHWPRLIVSVWDFERALFRTQER
jgi:hypothetical protein